MAGGAAEEERCQGDHNGDRAGEEGVLPLLIPADAQLSGLSVLMDVYSVSAGGGGGGVAAISLFSTPQPWGRA